MTGIGLAIPARSADDHFVAALVHSFAEPLIAQGMGLFTRVVPDARAEEDIYRRWAGSEGIAGVALLGGRDDEERVDLLVSLGLPFAAVVSGDARPEVAGVVVDIEASVAVVADFLDRRRHERAVFLAAPTDSVTSRARADALADRIEVVRVEHSAASAVSAAERVLSRGPATLLFDSDVHAVAAADALAQAGTRIPENAAIVSWTDSALCRSATPSITAVDRRGGDIGALLGHRMLAAIAGEAPDWDRAPDPFIVRRESA